MAAIRCWNPVKSIAPPPGSNEGSIRARDAPTLRDADLPVKPGDLGCDFHHARGDVRPRPRTEDGDHGTGDQGGCRPERRAPHDPAVLAQGDHGAVGEHETYPGPLPRNPAGHT